MSFIELLYLLSLSLSLSVRLLTVFVLCFAFLFSLHIINYSLLMYLQPSAGDILFQILIVVILLVLMYFVIAIENHHLLNPHKLSPVRDSIFLEKPSARRPKVP